MAHVACTYARTHAHALYTRVRVAVQSSQYLVWIGSNGDASRSADILDYKIKHVRRNDGTGVRGRKRAVEVKVDGQRGRTTRKRENETEVGHTYSVSSSTSRRSVSTDRCAFGEDCHRQCRSLQCKRSCFDKILSSARTVHSTEEQEEVHTFARRPRHTNDNDDTATSRGSFLHGHLALFRKLTVIIKAN